jgi:hypothetical protein
MKFLTWGESLGRAECPYLKRWVLNLSLFSLRIHHWLSSDDDRNFHDHPWWFLTFVIRGGYTDVNPLGRERVGRWSVKFRPALHRHTVEVDTGGCWTILLCGPILRSWGFWVKEKFLKANKYFYQWGHHPCNEV